MPGTFCPLNKFGVFDYGQLARLEAPVVHRRQVQIEETGMPGTFDLGHLRKIHYFLFRDVYPWAGEFRLVDMSKPGGTPFGRPEFIEQNVRDILAELQTEDFLSGLSEDGFADRAAYFWGEINAIHAFREGNGRTQREFLRQLGLRCGWILSWEGITRAENTAAAILSHTQRDYSGLAGILRRAIVGKIEEK